MPRGIGASRSEKEDGTGRGPATFAEFPAVTDASSIGIVRGAGGQVIDPPSVGRGDERETVMVPRRGIPRTLALVGVITFLGASAQLVQSPRDGASNAPVTLGGVGRFPFGGRFGGPRRFFCPTV